MTIHTVLHMSQFIFSMVFQRLFHSLDKPVHLDFSQYDRVTVVLFLRYLYTGTVPNQNGMKAVKGLALRYIHKHDTSV